MNVTRRDWYNIPIKYLGIPAVIIFLFGLIFAPLRDALFDEATAQEVLLQAIPFVAIFISIVMLFMLVIAFVAIRLHKRVTHRTHYAIEITLVAGILVGLVSMFQAVNIIGYQYGFLLVLFSLLSFILWTHVTPRSVQRNQELARFTARENGVGAVTGLIFAALLAFFMVSNAQPQAPYGMRQRQWDSLNEERQAEISGVAQTDFQRLQVPYLILISIIPGLLIFFAVREVLLPESAIASTQTPASGTTILTERGTTQVM